MNVDAIKLKHGRDWSLDETDVVFAEQCQPGKLERRIGLANAKTRNEDHAKETVQRAFIRAAKALPTFDPKKGSFDGWLGKIIVNEAITVVREHKRRQTLNHNYQDATQPMYSHNNNRQPIVALAGRIPQLSDEFAWDELKLLLDKLPEKCRYALELCVKDGMSNEDAAGKAGCSVSALGVRLYRAREILRPFIRKELENEP